MTQTRTTRLHTVRTRRFLEAALVLAVFAGAVVFYFGLNERISFLYYFFVPVATGSVLFGRRVGLTYAATSILLILALLFLTDLSSIDGSDRSDAEKTATLLAWMVFLVLTAYVVGWVSERGGNRALLQGVGADALAAVERERKRMGFDIHDGIAQIATTTLMEVEVLEAVTENAPADVREQVSRLKDLCAQEVREIRTMIGNLRPPQLSPAEFPETLARLISEFRDQTGVKTEVSIAGDLTTHTDSMRICVYRVVQEALSNIDQHADASRARVGIRATESSVFMTIADDGVGFDPTVYLSANGNGHFGLAGMQERVALLAGRMKIDSAPGHGTVISAHIPGVKG